MKSPQTENGYVKIANEIVDYFAKTYLSPNEWKVLWAVMRKTWGWNKKTDKISITQFEELTQLSRPSIIKSINKLVAVRLLVAVRQPSGNTYQIQKDYSKWDSSCRRTSSGIATSTSSGTATKGSSGTATYKRQLKTIKDKYINIRELNDFHFQQIADKYNVPLSFVRSKYDDMLNWHESTGKRRKDWIATLRNFVKKDALKIKKEANNDKRIVVV